jgi:hypothetical protein
MLAAGAMQFAFEKATTEGKITIGALLILSLFSWTIIITKFRQLYIARKWAKKFFAAYNATRDPLDIKRKAGDFEGAPAYQLYNRGADELDYHLKNNPVTVKEEQRISAASFEAVKVTLEEAAAAERWLSRDDRPSTAGLAGRSSVCSARLGRDGNLRRHREGPIRESYGDGSGVAGAHRHRRRPARRDPAMFAYNFRSRPFAGSRRSSTALRADTLPKLSTPMWIIAISKIKLRVR